MNSSQMTSPSLCKSKVEGTVMGARPMVASVSSKYINV